MTKGRSLNRDRNRDRDRDRNQVLMTEEEQLQALLEMGAEIIPPANLGPSEPVEPDTPELPPSVPIQPTTPTEPAAPPTTAGPIRLGSSAIDALGIVHQFVLQVAQINEPGVPRLQSDQILRGWQALGMRDNVSELCIITLLRSERHGFGCDYVELSADESMEPSTAWIEKMTEHVVQIDFMGLAQKIETGVTKRRADQVEMVAMSPYGAAIFRRINPAFSCLYCEPVASLGEMDGTSSIKHRHMVTLHISEKQRTSLPVSTFGEVSLYTENALEHHKPK